MPFSFVPRMQHSGGSVSVWGCMTSAGVRPLAFYEGRVNGPGYIQVIGDVLPPFIEDTFDLQNGNWQFMHDNAPPHRSKFAMNFFEKKTHSGHEMAAYVS